MEKLRSSPFGGAYNGQLFQLGLKAAAVNATAQSFLLGGGAGSGLGAARMSQIRSAPSAVNITRSRFGHTFDRHGQNATQFITHRARGSGQASGQFLDDQVAARFINSKLNSGALANGARTFSISKDFPARMIYPNGKFGPATGVRIIPRGKGAKTAYPVP